MNLRAMLMGAAACTLPAILLSACHPFKSLSCHAPKEYERAVQRAALEIPDGLDAPAAQGALVIPKVTGSAPARSDKTPCLEEPPLYKTAPAKPAQAH